jgi:GNAT-family acetyltransferase (TIGR03103 family)
MTAEYASNLRLNRTLSPSLRNWDTPPAHATRQMVSNASLWMGWGRLIFAHTFTSPDEIAGLLRDEEPGTRNLAFYLRDPHVLLSQSPQEFFLDPSHTYRLWSHRYRPGSVPPKGFAVRRVATSEDAKAANRIFASRKMVPWDGHFVREHRASKERTFLVAESMHDRTVVGTVTGVDHVEGFDDPENGASLWSLAVDPQAQTPGVGEGLVRHLVEHYFARGRDYVDLSVMHDNVQAIRLYEKLGFQRVPVFCVKRKNVINEPLFISPQPDGDLNPYARIIVDEARRRGIRVEVLDADFGYFRLEMGGRSIVCRESLTELTSAIAFSRCDDKRLTNRLLERAGLRVPSQQQASDEAGDRAYLRHHGRLVVKPARGEQGHGVFVDIRTPDELAEAIHTARQSCADVVLEEFVSGQDLRLIVIDGEMVAAAVREPPCVVGNGRDTVTSLIEKYSRRRAAATGGESTVPIDKETARCVGLAGYAMDTIPPSGEAITVRKTANLHSGGTIHDVTERVHPELAQAAVQAAHALDIPVVGFDFAVPDLEGPDYWIIEANERPGLANHEPQPTAERFIDLLFPQTASRPHA